MKRDALYWESPAGIAEAAAIAADRAREARERMEDAECEELARLRLIGIPPKDIATLRSPDTLKQTPAMLALADDRVLTCLAGNAGVGKTVAASAWLYGAQEGLFVKAARLSRWDRYDVAEMDRLLEAPRLVIDDLGTEYQDAKGNFMAILDEVIDVRYDHGRPTVITTNITDVEVFRQRYGARIAGRIREVGRFVILGGSDLRGAQ